MSAIAGCVADAGFAPSTADVTIEHRVDGAAATFAGCRVPGMCVWVELPRLGASASTQDGADRSCLRRAGAAASRIALPVVGSGALVYGALPDVQALADRVMGRWPAEFDPRPLCADIGDWLRRVQLAGGPAGSGPSTRHDASGRLADALEGHGRSALDRRFGATACRIGRSTCDSVLTELRAERRLRPAHGNLVPASVFGLQPGSWRLIDARAPGVAPAGLDPGWFAGEMAEIAGALDGQRPARAALLRSAGAAFLEAWQGDGRAPGMLDEVAAHAAARVLEHAQHYVTLVSFDEDVVRDQLELAARLLRAIPRGGLP